jgi:hypothetical protein
MSTEPRRPSNRARLRCLSGVQCADCGWYYVIRGEGKRAGWWTCGRCSKSWQPTAEEIAAYNGRVRQQDRIEGGTA